MLVSSIMIAQASGNSWSGLLTSLVVVIGRATPCRGRVFTNVSNPAQHRPPWPVMVNLLQERAKVYGESSVQRSSSSMPRGHYRCIRQAVFTT
jgi:hypothetical protein